MLIVEDEPYVLLLAETLLGQSGYETIPAHTLVQAVVIIQSCRTVDLVFTDIQLGDHADGGITVGELVNRERPGTPVLYTSGQAATGNLHAFPAKTLHRLGIDQSRGGPATGKLSRLDGD